MMMNFDLLQQLSRAKILVVGDVMLDRYYYGDTQRISPEAPVPVVHVKRIEDRAGGAANVARNIAHLDGQVTLLGIIGDDAEGDSLQRLLTEEHIQSSLYRQTAQPTIAKMRVVSRHQQVVRLDMEQRFSPASAAQLAQAFVGLVDGFDWVIFSDYNKGSLAQISSMIQAAKKAGKPVMVDPKQTDLCLYAGADVITPNVKEFLDAGGDMASEVSMLASARALLEQAGIGAMLLTRSEQGMSYITAQTHYHVPAQVLEVSDVTGAGDTVIASLAVMLAAGFEAEQAVALANLCAGIVVSKLGAATVSPEELAAKLNQYLNAQGDRYLAPFDAVLQHIGFAKQNGERIVFTNGCFDILHAGHVRYLNQAKALGDRLVVGLNSDASVRRLKGDARPINSLEDRAAVLAGLACVDWVVPFGDSPEEQDTPLKLIQQVAPDVLVKGGDYSIDSIVGADFVLAQGGEVKVLSFVAGKSTTGIINKARGEG
ncbi:bifunctional D-glycero-beta-D-manno-heptose-7-phosphate kinase/D-glycero-beta-D-manno-heptose 1-phosphate adenylyltransferase HldE [Thiomicrospira microaerophila]|uniref:bifunctional D-glycero-beta-D-manno-heptose-7-phosphate kinase/D-glycero-beta-D-manno-heptose 1-phosphate adenylyltransferase HldE n=1 Tax=Thiomicrospira microaerophila TaxID=406020 RepID=UPI00200E31EA|nr:bifunctional D-glycero-beta-D-manno-heptose-7-phosphate kinase/D-glycero-beta-D-manno-heptose 1-phosphate adenylyltransferase HldE [Thiomicrospira microaerophila]UQB42428.1 bifunctional D-glycero-beta-D-manno-heptose-7-phosphate kinase/D-glycero-beta-D-manno-heptose 1-phosphate adenylyltransferase HldE [Thiomicrospira microaerophila]